MWPLVKEMLPSDLNEEKLSINHAGHVHVNLQDNAVAIVAAQSVTLVHVQ